MWAESDGFNIATHLLFDSLDIDGKQFDFITGLPAGGVPLIVDELSARKARHAEMLAAYKRSFTADEDPQIRMRIAYELEINQAGIRRAKDFLEYAKEVTCEAP